MLSKKETVIMKIMIDVFYGIEYDKLFPISKKAGFDGFFSGEIYANDFGKLQEIEKMAKANGIEWETSHSTIPQSQAIWSCGDAGDEYVKTLISNIDNCKRFGVPTLVVHICPDFSAAPSFERGIERLKPAVEYAKSLGVKIAFENINSPEYLYGALDKFDESHVGFCYDCGHEACHTPGERYLPKIGNRLFCTHLHDNDGKGDCHWLPFDGVIDFEKMAYEMKACNYRGNLTLELAYHSFYGEKYTREEFLSEAYSRVKRLSDMIER